MTQVTSMSAATCSPETSRLSTAAERAANTVLFHALRPLPTGSVKGLPDAATCQLARTAAASILSQSPMVWRDAIVGATRLASALPGPRADSADKAAILQELAKEIANHPAAIARDVVDGLMATCKWRPVPADVRAMASARTQALRDIVDAADRLLRHRTAVAEAAEREAAERAERLAAAGPMTEAERRAWVVADAMAKFRGQAG